MQRKDKNPPRVSVLIANYNGERFLAAAIESVLSQSFTDFELIVVDDGSTDKSVSLLNAYASKDKRLRVFCFPQNRGFAQALNYGLSVSRGEYVARMDSDDLCHRDRLLQQISYLDKHAEIHVLGCRYRAIDEKGDFCSVAAARRLRKQPITLARGRHRVAKRVLLGPYPVLHPTIVCRRSTLLSIGGYREFFPIAEDDDLYSRIVSMHGRVLDNLPKQLYYYRHYGGSMSQRFDRSLHLLILRIIGLSSEFRRRGFWDPLDERPSSTCGGLRFKGVSSLLFLQDSLVFLPYFPREGFYYWLRVVVILRRFGLKDFRQVSFWREWGMTMSKQIYFYTSFGLKCFCLQKFRASFLYFRYIFSLYSRVSPFTAFSSFLIIIFSLIYFFFKIHKIVALVMFTVRRSKNHLFLSRSSIFTSSWHDGVKHLFIAFFYNPFFVIKFFVIRFFVHFSRMMPVFYRKLGF